MTPTDQGKRKCSRGHAKQDGPGAGACTTTAPNGESAPPTATGGATRKGILPHDLATTMRLVAGGTTKQEVPTSFPKTRNGLGRATFPERRAVLEGEGKGPGTTHEGDDAEVQHTDPAVSSLPGAPILWPAGMACRGWVGSSPQRKMIRAWVVWCG